MAASRRLDVMAVDVGDVRSPRWTDAQVEEQLDLDRGCCTATPGPNVAPGCWQLSGGRRSRLTH